MAVSPVISSMMVACANLDILIEVNTTKQKPIRLEEVFNMCGDFPFGILKCIKNKNNHVQYLVEHLTVFLNFI